MVSDQDPQRVCILQDPSRTPVVHSKVEDKSIKEIFCDISVNLIRNLLDRYCGGNASKVRSSITLLLLPLSSSLSKMKPLSHSTPLLLFPMPTFGWRISPVLRGASPATPSFTDCVMLTFLLVVSHLALAGMSSPIPGVLPSPISKFLARSILIDPGKDHAIMS